MAAAARGALSATYMQSKRSLAQLLVAVPCFSGRHLSHCASSSSNSSTSNLEGTARGLQEFVKWHNGGGLFHMTASVDPSVCIEVGAIVHQDAVLEADVHIGSGSVVGPSVSIGQTTKMGYNAVLSNCSVGLSCVIHNGACIGQDGFGFFVGNDGKMAKKPQVDSTCKDRRPCGDRC